MRKFLHFGVHRRRFIVLATVIFLFITIGYIAKVFFGWDIVFKSSFLSSWSGSLAVFVTAMMAVMGMYYIFAQSK